jgi:DNA-binding transcriptional MerR regulator
MRHLKTGKRSYKYMVPQLPINRSVKTHYRTEELARITGMTLRRLQWLDEQGIVRPGQENGASGTGFVRKYTVHEAVEVAVIAELRRKGLSLRQVRPFQKHIRKAIREDEHYVLILGKTAHVLSDQREIISLAAKSGSSIVLVDIVEHFKLLT